MATGGQRSGQVSQLQDCASSSSGSKATGNFLQADELLIEQRQSDHAFDVPEHVHENGQLLTISNDSAADGHHDCDRRWSAVLTPLSRTSQSHCSFQKSVPRRGD